MTIPKNPALNGSQLYFQNVAFNPKTGRGAFCAPAGLEIGK